MGAIRKIEASLPTITYKGAAVGVQSVTQAVSTAAAQVAKPIEQAAAVTVAAAASVFTGLPITPQIVNQAATEIKTNTYAKPNPNPPQTVSAQPALKTLPTLGAPTLAETVAGTVAAVPTWQKVGAVLAVAAAAAYFMRGKK